MKFSPKLGVTLAALAALGLAASNAANAQTASFSIDGTGAGGGGVYTPYTGTAVLPGVFTPVLAGTGISGGVTFASSGFGNGTFVDTPAGTPGTAAPALLGSFLFGFDGSGTITLSGFSGSPEDVVVYAGQEGTIFSINGSTGQFVPGQPIASATLPTSPGTGSGPSYYDFTGVTPVSGVITIAATSTAIAAYGGHSFTEVAGVQVAPTAAVPEASSAIGFGVLLALGGLAVVARKRTVKA